MNLSSFQPITKQDGVVLLEALISILIFSIGILAIIALQAASIKNVGDAKYRSDASMCANQLFGAMWINDRKTVTPLPGTQVDTVALSNDFSTGGPRYTTWMNDLKNTLPGVDSNPPTVVITTVPGGSAQDLPSSLVTVTLFWQAPEEVAASAPAHQFIASTLIH